MSKLIDKLERASSGGVTPLGFGPATARERVAPLLLLGAVRVGDKQEAGRAAEAGLDAAFLLSNGAAPKAQIATSAGSLGEVPWGLWSADADPAPAEGSDFQVIVSDSTPLTLLEGEEPANVMVVAPEMEDGLLRTIDDLPVDAFLVSLAEAGPLTVRQLMRISRVRRATSKYLLVHLPFMPATAELKPLMDGGVGGLVIDVQGRNTEELKACRARLLELPARRARDRRRAMAIVPSSGFAAEPPPPRRDDDDDDEEEDD